MSASLGLLRERVIGVAAMVRRARFGPTLPDALGWDVTGAGGSEGPARALMHALACRGRVARFVPLSSFAIAEPAPRATGLVVFSQGMSPNARLALRAREGYAHTLLVSATEPEADVEVLRHEPAAERELLVRVAGPVMATLAAFHLGGMTVDTAAIADAIERAAERAPDTTLSAPLALVTAGPRGPLAHGLRWKLLESLAVGDPPVWDVLQVAHGPFQQFYDGPLTLVSLEHDVAAERRLFDRLASMLVPDRHRLIRLVAKHPLPVSWFEHDAMLNQLVLRTLSHEPRDLVDWPGKGADHALYMLDEPVG